MKQIQSRIIRITIKSQNTDFLLFTNLEIRKIQNGINNILKKNKLMIWILFLNCKKYMTMVLNII